MCVVWLVIPYPGHVEGPSTGASEGRLPLHHLNVLLVCDLNKVTCSVLVIENDIPPPEVPPVGKGEGEGGGKRGKNELQLSKKSNME